METKNLGLVKAMFRQATSPVRTDVWWFDTINNILKYWDTVTLTWRPITEAGLFTQITCPYDDNALILLGSVDTVIAVAVTYAGFRGGKRMSGKLQGVFTEPPGEVNVYTPDNTPVSYNAETGVSFQLNDDGTYYYLRVSVDNSSTDNFEFLYKIELMEMENLPPANSGD